MSNNLHNIKLFIDKAQKNKIIQGNIYELLQNNYTDNYNDDSYYKLRFALS